MKHTYPLLAVLAALGLAGCATTSPVQIQPVDNPVPPLADGNYDKSSVTVPPVAVRRVGPKYPVELRNTGVIGEAIVMLTVANDGTVRDVFAQRATDARFGEAAVTAVRQWRFQPAQIDGHAVNCRISVPFRFNLPRE